MSRLDALPADQKSVLQLLLRQGKGYDDLSGLLRLDADEVRSRAYDALDTLGPGAGGLSAERRHEIADWLLGQQDPEEAVATRAFVDGSTAGRVWAHGVARELEPLAGDRLPELPAEGAVDAGRSRDPKPVAEADDDAPTAFAPAATAGPRVSRRGGALLIGGALAAIAIAVVLVIVLTGGGSDDKPDSTATQAANTTSTQAQPQVRAQVNLTPPKGAPVKKAVAIVQFVDLNGQQAINAATQGLPTSKKIVYGLWFYNSKSQAKLIGGFDQTDNKGHLVLQGQLPKGVDIASYKDLVITREKPSTNPTSPGHDLPARVDPERRRRLVRRQQLAGVHDPGRIELALEGAQRGHAGVPHLGADVPGVVAAHRVVMGDRPAGGDDRLATPPPSPRPLRELLAAPRPRHEREVQRGARRIQVRDVAGDQRGVVAQRVAHRAVEREQLRPRRGRLERLDEHAAVHQIVAQVGPVEARAHPRAPRRLPEGDAARVAQRLDGRLAAHAHGLVRARPADDGQRPARHAAGAQIGLQRRGADPAQAGQPEPEPRLLPRRRAAPRRAPRRPAPGAAGPRRRRRSPGTSSPRSG